MTASSSSSSSVVTDEDSLESSDSVQLVTNTHHSHRHGGGKQKRKKRKGDQLLRRTSQQNGEEAQLSEEEMLLFCRTKPQNLPNFAEMTPIFRRAIVEKTVPNIQSIFICTCVAPKSRSCWRSMFRWCLSWVTKSHHIEIAFVLEDATHVHGQRVFSCSVDFDEPTRFDEVSPGQVYHRDYWNLYHVDLPPVQRLGLYWFCAQQAGKPMDQLTLYMNLPILRNLVGSSPPERNGNEDRWFCSQLVAAAFKYIGLEVLVDVNPRNVVPSRMFEILYSDNTLFRMCDSIYPPQMWNV